MTKIRTLWPVPFLVLIIGLALFGLLTGAALAQEGGDEEAALEVAKAMAAEQNPAPPQIATTLLSGGVNPLFVGVDDVTVPTYLIDPTTNISITAFVGTEVWGSAYDGVNDRILFNSGSTLYEWPIGGAVSPLGTITDPAGAALSMVGLAFYNGTIYASRNIANEAIYAIDTGTLVATVHIDYVDADFDFGGLAADPNTGDLYGTNDDTTPNGSGLFRINPDGTGTLITPYPAGQTDIDGLAVSDDGFAYLVIDEPGDIFVWDFGAGAYAAPLTNPWTSSEVFSAGAYIVPTAAPSIAMTKTVGTTPGVCATTDSIAVPAGTVVYYCYEVTNTGDVSLDIHDLDDDQLGNIFTALLYDLGPGASVDTVAAGLEISATINATTVNSATWTSYNPNDVDLVTANDTATVTVGGISLAKTVGTTPGVCATTNNINVPFSLGGTVVYYCYEVTNTGTFTLPFHDLVDSELGIIFTGLPYDLGPGASVDTVAAGLTISATITAPTVNTATWSAYSAGIPPFEATATASVGHAPTGVALSEFGAGNLSTGPFWLAVLVLGSGLVAVGLRRRRQLNH